MLYYASFAPSFKIAVRSLQGKPVKTFANVEEMERWAARLDFKIEWRSIDDDSTTAQKEDWWNESRSGR